MHGQQNIKNWLICFWTEISTQVLQTTYQELKSFGSLQLWP